MADNDPDWDEYLRNAAAAEPGALDRVVEVADMMSSFAAQRLVRVDAMRAEALADAARYGTAIVDVVERSVRFELATALRVIENAAAVLLAQAGALVHRYPSVLQSLAQARITERHADILVEAVEAVDALEPELREGVVARALALAELQPVRAFRRSVRKRIDTTRYVTLAERHEVALQSRRVIVLPDEDGMAWVS